MRSAGRQTPSFRVQFVFVLLQLGDIATTMTVLQMGGAEKNPLLSRLMVIGSLQALILSKAIVFALGTVAVRAHRPFVLRCTNAIFAVIVTWNLVLIGRLVFQARGHS